MKASSYVDGMPDGDACVVTYEDGTFFDGGMKKGLRHGEGIMTYNGGYDSSDQLVLKATWDNDRIISDAKITLGSGVQIIAHKNLCLPNFEKYFLSHQVSDKFEVGYDAHEWDSIINQLKTASDLSYLRYVTLDYGTSSYTG